MLKLCDIIRWLLAVLIVLSATSCVADEDTSSGSAKASLAFSVSTQRASTRMNAAATQQEGSVFRGITNQRFYPFGTEGKIQGTDTPLGDFVAGLDSYKSTLFYYKNKGLDIPVGTASFLCYCSAAQGSYDQFAGGALVPTLPESPANASAISFSPKKIYEDATTVDEKATAIADYLTAIANEIKNSEVENKDDLFNQFINYGHIIPASSSYVKRLESWITSKNIDLPTKPTTPAGFDDYISKPIDIDELEKVLSRYLPESCIKARDNEELSDDNDAKMSSFESELPKNIDTAAGLKNCMDDESFYRELLSDYASSAEEKINRLESFKNDGLTEDYRILIHSIKSSSKTVGDLKAAELAQSLEAAAAGRDMQFINEHHREFCEGLRLTAELITKALS